MFFPAFIVNIGFHLDLDHHGSVGDEKDLEEDAEVDMEEWLHGVKSRLRIVLVDYFTLLVVVKAGHLSIGVEGSKAGKADNPEEEHQDNLVFAGK